MSSRKRCCIGNVNIKLTAGWEKGIKLCCGLVRRCITGLLCYSISKTQGCITGLLCYSISETQDNLESQCFNFLWGFFNLCVPQTFPMLIPGVTPADPGTSGTAGTSWVNPLLSINFEGTMIYPYKEKVTPWNHALGMSFMALQRRKSAFFFHNLNHSMQL